jgi:hypothetical protein
VDDKLMHGNIWLAGILPLQVIKSAMTSTGIMGLFKAGWTTIKVRGNLGMGCVSPSQTAHTC